jgi:hypothetical protein
MSVSAKTPLRRESPMWHRLAQFTRYERLLFAVFLLTLPFVRPWLHGDGFGYYAFARTLLIQHDLNFEEDLHKGYETNPEVMKESFREKYLVPATGRFANHFTLGPAILWSPFLIPAHIFATVVDKIRGTHLSADGFSKPYIIAMALGTAIYGFLGVWLSFLVARKYLPERWAGLAAFGIWFASPLAFYIYVDPSFSHAHSAFVAALFVWYWDRTRGTRTRKQWLILGLISGLLINVYYPNALLLMLPLLESMSVYWNALRHRQAQSSTAPEPAVQSPGALFANNLLFALINFVLFIPAMITKKILFGGYLKFGYKEHWYWNSPAFFKTWLSADHGLFTWTPILIFAVLGLVLLLRKNQLLGSYFLILFLAYTYFIGCYETWHGLHSYGARFFVSLTVLFVVGLAAFLDWIASLVPARSLVLRALPAAIALLALWNFGLMFQFGLHLVPPVGPISFRDAAYNQVAVVPVRSFRMLSSLASNRLHMPRHDGGSQTASPQANSSTD